MRSHTETQSEIARLQDELRDLEWKIFRESDGQRVDYLMNRKYAIERKLRQLRGAT